MFHFDRILLVLGLSFGVHSAWGGTFTIKRIKGHQALVTIQGENLEAGKTYSFASGAQKGFFRDHFISLSAVTFSSLSQSISGTSSSVMRLNFLGSFGWNKGQWEYGPILGFGSSGTSASTSTSYTLGGRGDYNFAPNTLDTSYLLGVGLQATSERATSPTSSTAQTETAMSLLFFWKWFVFSPSTCLRIDAGYQYSKYTGTTDLTETGLALSGGFGVYF